MGMAMMKTVNATIFNWVTRHKSVWARQVGEPPKKSRLNAVCGVRHSKSNLRQHCLRRRRQQCVLNKPETRQHANERRARRARVQRAGTPAARIVDHRRRAGIAHPAEKWRTRSESGRSPKPR
eukprot:904463-Prymnesium_polylepis.1